MNSSQTSTSSLGGFGPVFAVSFSVAGIIAAELLPASLLTPMARDLDVTAGAAGQTITATAVAAMIASLFVSRLTRGIDRKTVLLTFSLLMAGSSLLTALATDFTVMIVARIVLGFSLGGFWAISAATAMRLVPPDQVPKALSIIFAGVSVAMVISAPLGSLLGGLIGWRGVFVGMAIMGMACWLWQRMTLASMPANPESRNGGILEVARRPQVAIALSAIFCAFAGQFAFFTYMRPFYEGVAGLDLRSLSGILLLFGIANFAGTSLSGIALRRHLTATLAIAPAVLVLCAAGLVLFGSTPIAVAVLTALWGFAFGTVPVGWSTWVTRKLPDAAEAAGGLQVAVIQLANTTGAALGGALLDMRGPLAPVIAAGVLLSATTLIVTLGLRRRPAVVRPAMRRCRTTPDI